MKKSQDLSIMSKNLRSKIIVAFCLMSVIPILISIYLAFTYIFGKSIWDVVAIIGIGIILALLGFYIVQEIIDPIIRLSFGVRSFAMGEVKKLPVLDRKDEIGDLSKSLGLISGRIEELKVIDEDTKLYTRNFIIRQLTEEINRGMLYHRPSSFAMFGIDDFKKYKSIQDEKLVSELIHLIGNILMNSIEGINKVALFDDGQFAVLMPETNKKEAYRIAEDIRKGVEKFKFPLKARIEGKNPTVSAGMSENPLDGMTVDELMEKAKKSLEAAFESGGNRVV